MTIDEQVSAYMRGWYEGVVYRDDKPLKGRSDYYERGYRDGQAAWKSAKWAERGRLEECPVCCGTKTGPPVDLGTNHHTGMSYASATPCAVCHGTGKRP